MAECTSCASALRIKTDIDTVEGTCPTTGFQKATVCVPVTVAPFANTGPTVTKCCGDPVLVTGDKPCRGKKNGVCTFTISQTICVEVPVNFGARAMVGDTFVECLAVSTEDICNNCKKEDEEYEYY